MTQDTTTPARVRPTVDTLDELVDFDGAFTIHEDGTLSYRPELYAPDLLDEQITGTTGTQIGGSGWSFFSTGYSGQHGYSGPVMHSSEYVGGGLARDILATPGTYVLVVAYWTEDDEQDGPTPEGWAVLRLDDDATAGAL